jgi:hypothetical protein
METLHWDLGEWDPEVDFQLGFITSFFGYYAKKVYKVGLRCQERTYCLNEEIYTPVVFLKIVWNTSLNNYGIILV